MYADGRELLVFRTFSQSVSVPKRVFRHADRLVEPVYCLYKKIQRLSAFKVIFNHTCGLMVDLIHIAIYQI